MPPALIALWVLFFLLAPAGVVQLCRRFRFFNKTGAILTLYFLGLIVGNTLIFPFDGAAGALFPVQDLLTSITIPLAMPLILFACDFRNWPVRKALVSLLIGIAGIVITVVAGYFLFRDKLGTDAAAVAGMTVGVYTGGTPNLAAIKMMLGVDERTYLLMNSFDMLVSFLYLSFLMAAGIRLARRLLGTGDGAGPVQAEQQTSRMARSESEMYRGIFSKTHLKPTLKALGTAALITGISLGFSLLISGKVDMIILILSLTTLSLAASFLPAVRKWEKSYDAGMYLVLIFSLVVASMVDIRGLDLREGVWLLAYIVFAIFGSLSFQLILGKIFRVDADTSVITSVAMINSPLFVPMIAESMKNRKVILTGITIGIIGYAFGNYLGILIAQLLG